MLVGEPKEGTENDLYMKCCEEGQHDQYLGIVEKEKLAQPTAETLRRYIFLLLLSCQIVLLLLLILYFVINRCPLSVLLTYKPLG